VHNTSLPLVREFDARDEFEALFERWASRPYVVRLEGGWDPQGAGRFSYLGLDPYLVIRSDGAELAVMRAAPAQSAGGPWIEETSTGDPFDLLKVEYEQIARVAARLDLPFRFQGGAAGFLGYGLRTFVERVPRRVPDDLGLPDMFFAFFDVIFAFDHLTHKVYVASSGLPERGEVRRARAAARLNEAVAQLLSGERRAFPGPVPFASLGADHDVHGGFAEPAMEKSAYLRCVERAKEYIAAGDVYQVNFAQRFSVPIAASPYEVFRTLQSTNPAPFGAYINGGAWSVVSVSPERFFWFDGKVARTSPIKGTRPRGADEASDRALRKELAASIKDQAEHIMIVDLERNDLGRFCEFGSVWVPELMKCEAHPTVWHLVSTVEGRPRPGVSIIDGIRSAFPGGSITGAPKVRAMEIIDELEPVARGVYTGSIGYFGIGNQIDLNIAIRTVVIKDGRAYFHVGGGIVADSDPESEYHETIVKGMGIARALARARAHKGASAGG